MVENGDYCKRGNSKSFDINRNWDFFWSKSLESDSPGPSAFSEIETQFIRDAVKSYEPLMFLSIHSGVFGLFYPYAFNSVNFIKNSTNFFIKPRISCRNKEN